MRTTGATDEQIEVAAYADCLAYFNGDKKTADLYFADGSWQTGTIKTVQQWATLLVPTDHRIVRVDDLRAIEGAVDWRRQPWRIREAFNRLQAAIGEAE